MVGLDQISSPRGWENRSRILPSGQFCPNAAISAYDWATPEPVHTGRHYELPLDSLPPLPLPLPHTQVLVQRLPPHHFSIASEGSQGEVSETLGEEPLRSHLHQEVSLASAFSTNRKCLYSNYWIWSSTIQSRNRLRITTWVDPISQCVYLCKFRAIGKWFTVFIYLFFTLLVLLLIATNWQY